jgi:N-acetylgalactosamine 4-sulfate 6-O-sulfotransferase
MYFVFLYDWFQVFPRSQFQIIKSERYYKDRESTLNETFTFLGVKTLSQSELSYVADGPVWHALTGGGMFAETKQLLEDFYKPYNIQLAQLLDDQEFAWG